VALGGASAHVRTRKPTWNTKRRLERQQEGHVWTRTEVGSEDYVGTHFRYIGGRFGLVDSAREKNKARAVAEIYRALLKRGRYHGLRPFDTTKTKIENR